MGPRRERHEFHVRWGIGVVVAVLILGSGHRLWTEKRQEGVEDRRFGRGGDGETGGVVGTRYAIVVALGIVGGFVSGLFRVPLGILAPEWFFTTVPLALGALCASGLAHLASGPRGGSFSRVVLAALTAAVLCAVINLALVLATVAGVLYPLWVLGPPGFLSGFAEVLAVGTVAGVAATKGSPARRRSNLRVWTLVLGGVALLLFGAIALPGTLACSSEERDVFTEFPQYGGLRVEPSGNPDRGSCAAYYSTRDSADEVFRYFGEQFEENGWEERPAESYRVVVEGGEEFCVPIDLIAERGDFRYGVSVEEMDPEAGRHALGTGVAAHISRIPEDQRVIPPSGPPPGCRLRSPGSSGR